MPDRGFRLPDIGYCGYVPEFVAVPQSLVPWDGSLRSALFPRNQALGNCLQQWICDE